MPSSRVAGSTAASTARSNTEYSVCSTEGDIPVLAARTEAEIVYRLLQTPLAPSLRQYREYRRTFGLPPVQDAAHLRQRLA